jgi:hypothetical protein
MAFLNAAEIRADRVPLPSSGVTTLEVSVGHDFNGSDEHVA